MLGFERRSGDEEVSEEQYRRLLGSTACERSRSLELALGMTEAWTTVPDRELIAFIHQGVFFRCQRVRSPAEEAEESLRRSEFWSRTPSVDEVEAAVSFWRSRSMTDDLEAGLRKVEEVLSLAPPREWELDVVDHAIVFVGHVLCTDGRNWDVENSGGEELAVIRGRKRTRHPAGRLLEWLFSDEQANGLTLADRAVVTRTVPW